MSYSCKIKSGSDCIAIIKTETSTPEDVARQVGLIIAHSKTRWPHDKVTVIGLPAEVEKMARKIAKKELERDERKQHR